MALKQVDEEQSRSRCNMRDQVIAKARRIVSGNGKTMTITNEEPEADPAVKNVSIYGKQ